MVRLRSERWYAGEGQRRSRAQVATRSSGARRLISLCFLLALVVLLMKKAADPIHVSRAFSALGVPLEPEEPESSTGIAARGQSAADSATESPVASEAAAWRLTCVDLVPKLMDSLTESQIKTISGEWLTLSEPSGVGTERGRSSDLSGDRFGAISAAATREELWELSKPVLQDAKATVDALSDAQPWQVALTRFESQWREFCVADRRQSSVELEDELADRLTSYIDEWLVAQLKDASPWMSREHFAFWRLLQRSAGRGKLNTNDQVDASELAVYPTLQLEAKSDEIKNHWIRFRGSVRLVEPIERSNEDTGISRYTLAWLRDKAGAAQPVAVYTTASTLDSLQPNPADPGSYVDVEIVGLVGKRLAYASESGAQVAPTIFARHVRVQKSAQAVGRSEMPSGQIWSDATWALVVGLLVAAVILVPILATWRNRRVKRRLPSSLTKGLWIGIIFGCSGPGIAATLPNTRQTRSGGNTQLIAAQVAGNQSVPWNSAKSQEQLRLELLDESLRSASDAQAMAAWRAYLNGESAGGVPDLPLKFQFHLRKLSPETLGSWEGVELADGYALVPFTLSGRARYAMQMLLDDLQQSWYQRTKSDKLFRLQIVSGDVQAEGEELSSTREPKNILTESLPSYWLSAPQLNQPVEVMGAKLVDPEGQFISGFALNLHWRVEDTSDESLLPQLSEQYRCFGELGWDLANFDLAINNMQKPLQASESTPLLELLRLLSDVDAEAWSDLGVEPESNPIKVLAEPAEQVGMPIVWQVRLVNASVVQVQQSENAGGSSYYQLNGFVNLGNRQIRYQLSNDAQNKEVISFEREFPVTILMKQPDLQWVPEAVRSGRELAWEVGKFVEVEGFFYRLWSFRSELLESKDSSARQAAPLVLATSLTLAPPPVRNNMSEVGWFGYALCFVIVIILGGILYSVFQKENRPKLVR